MENLETWLAQTQKQRDALFAHSKSQIPTDKSSLDDDIEKSIRAAEAAGAQFAMSRFYLTGAIAEAFAAIPPDVKGQAREILIDDKVKTIQLLHDNLENLAKSLNSRVKASCNGRRSLL